MIGKEERLKAAIAGEMADRPAVALWRHFPVDDQEPELLAQAIAAFQASYDFDFVKVTPASSFCILDWGVEDVWEGAAEGTRRYVRRVVHEVDDWRSLRVLQPESGALGAQLRCLRILAERLDRGTPFIQTIFSPLAQAKNLAGGKRLFEHLHRDPDAVLQGLETITQSTVAFIRAAVDTGVAGIFYAVQHASYQYFDRESYRRFGEVFDRRVLEAASDLWLNVLHLHGEAPIFDLAGEYPVQIVNWHDRHCEPDLSTGKNVSGIAVCGGLRREETMVLGDPGAVRREAQDALRSVDGRGMVLGAGCVIPILAPRANLMAAREAVEEFA